MLLQERSDRGGRLDLCEITNPAQPHSSRCSQKQDYHGSSGLSIGRAPRFLWGRLRGKLGRSEDAAAITFGWLARTRCLRLHSHCIIPANWMRECGVRRGAGAQVSWDTHYPERKAGLRS